MGVSSAETFVADLDSANFPRSLVLLTSHMLAQVAMSPEWQPPYAVMRVVHESVHSVGMREVRPADWRAVRPRARASGWLSKGRAKAAESGG